MTLPQVLNSYKKQEASAKLSKFYSTMSQAVLSSEIDNGSSESWDRSDVTKFWQQYFEPYVKGTRQGDNSNLKIYFLDGTTLTFNSSPSCMDFRYDVNGDKLPNIYGRDKFVFYMCQGQYTSIKFDTNWGDESKYESRETRMETCKASGMQCTSLLRFDNWEFKDDYPFHL